MSGQSIVDIVLPRRLWTQLRTHLIRPSINGRSTDEQLAFILAAPNLTSFGVRLLGNRLLLAQPSDLAHQSPGGIGPTPEFVATALSKCRAEGWSLIEVHSHPFDRSSHTTFSGIDWANDQSKMPSLAHVIPHHATMVMGQRSLDAHYWSRDAANIIPARQVVVVGADDTHQQPREQIATTTWLRHLDVRQDYEPDSRFNRHLKLFGKSGQGKLRETTVAIVGLGGLGSFLALELAYLGIGGLVLVDHDVVDTTNLNRLIGSGPDDIGRRKVDVYAQIIRRAAPDCQVVALGVPLIDAASDTALKGVDYIAGCVDNHGARLTLNHMALRYLIPLLDLGTGIHLSPGSRQSAQAGGQVQLVAPGSGCLECRSMIDPARAAFDLASPLEQQYERDHGYGVEEPAPSVIHLNGVVASVAAGELVRLIQGAADENPSQLIMYDGSGMRLFRVESKGHEDCVTCGDEEAVGVGDLAPPRASSSSAMLRAQLQLE
jgi:molybdopterin/thiamine biosynthesis adenylyltransferase